MNDRIEKRIELKAPVSRVWRAITDYKEFSEWFGVDLEGPFVAGQVTRGRLTFKGYEHVNWEAAVQKIEPENLFSFTWHPYAIEEGVDYSEEPPTLIEFKLQEIPTGTLLVISESGFDKIPLQRRAEAFRMDERGWAAQIESIQKHVDG